MFLDVDGRVVADEDEYVAAVAEATGYRTTLQHALALYADATKEIARLRRRLHDSDAHLRQVLGIGPQPDRDSMDASHSPAADDEGFGYFMGSDPAQD